MNASKTLVIGIGNLLRGDDGAGILATRALKCKSGDKVRILETSGDGLCLMEMWRIAEPVFVIDAISSGARPGSIRVIDACEQRPPFHLFRSSSHAFGLPQAVELARVLGELPHVLLIFGIEGEHFEPSSLISAAVMDAVSRVVDEVSRCLRTDGSDLTRPMSYIS